VPASYPLISVDRSILRTSSTGPETAADTGGGPTRSNAGFTSLCDYNSASNRCTLTVDFRRSGSKLLFGARRLIRVPNPDPSMPPKDTFLDRTYVLAGWVPTVRLSCPSWSGSRRHRICESPVDDGMIAQQVGS
jgi:hypothetical protein